MVKMNCLTHLLDLHNRGHKLKILYNSNHCIGVNTNKIFELGNEFKKDLLAGYSLKGGNSYLPIEQVMSCDDVIKSFQLDDKFTDILKQYYNAKV